MPKKNKTPRDSRPEDRTSRHPRAYSRHGLHAVKARIALRGLAAIDMCTVAAREMLAFRGELVAALGGDAELSPQRRKLVDLTRTVESRRAEVMG